ncbi:MAG: nitrous oxide reductase accessory protein NosL [Blastocatellia bacterium]
MWRLIKLSTLWMNVRVAVSPRRRVAASLLLFAICLSACGPNRRAIVKAEAATGYCPVCGMKVSAADETTAEIYFNDGTKLMFESPGDLLAFYTAPAKFKAAPVQQDLANITSVSFKDQQTKQAVDGRRAALVYGSRAEGPMGPDFFAFDKRSDAEAFVAANGGTIIGINEVTPDMAQTSRHGH